MTPTLEKFLDDVKNHELTIHQNNGVYRHLTFATPNDCNQHFNITTFPDHLVITGDMGTLVFSRLHDMFNFFRSDDLRINPDYWAEKIESTSYEVSIDIYSEFDIDEVKTCAQKDLDDFIRDNELSEEDESVLRLKLETSVLSAEHEHEIIDRITNFGCYGFDFEDFEWWDCRTHRYCYIWLCYAIVWGIKKFDEVTKLKTKELGKEHALARERLKKKQKEEQAEMDNKEFKKCPFCGNSCDVVSGLNQITFFYCVNEQCLAVISFGKAQSMKLAVNKFNKRKV